MDNCKKYTSINCKIAYFALSFGNIDVKTEKGNMSFL